jgi:hypothetical protein
MSEYSNTNTPVPFVVDLGKARKGAVRKLKQGRGRLMEEAQDVIDEVRAGLGEGGNNKEIVPIILVYRKKGSRRRKGKGFGLFPPFF